MVKKKKMKVELKLQHAVLGLEKEVLIQEECLKIMELQRVERKKERKKAQMLDLVLREQLIVQLQLRSCFH